MSGFDKWLRSRDDDVAIRINPQAHRGDLHDVFDVSDSKIALKFTTDQLVIVAR